MDPWSLEEAELESAESSQDPRAPKRRSLLSFLAELPILAVVALAVAVLIKTFLVQPFYIPSGSMEPTLEVNDRVLVSKLSYRLGEPATGDIVVFRNPYIAPPQESFVDAVVRNVLEAVGIRTAGADDFIKRVVATEGETVEIIDNVLLIDGRALPEPYVKSGSVMGDFGPVIVPPANVFVMGDNRSGSQDSRVFGPVSEEELVGRAFFRMWPPGRLGGI